MKHLTYDDRIALLEEAREAAREAAALVFAGWRTNPTIELKGPVDLVTEYDKRSEQLLRERLNTRTGIAVVGEEAGGERGKDGTTWFVDPLDGTTNFAHGHPYFCVSIGLVVDGSPVVGVVHAPALRVEWAAAIEGVFDTRVPEDARRVATRNGERCFVSSVNELLRALLATGFPYDVHTSPDNNLDSFVRLIRRCQAIRRCGSAAMDLCHVAEGAYDGYWERRLKPWDLAAGTAIVAAAGGTVSGYDGLRADVTVGHVLATNGRIHDALVAELRGHV